MSVLKTVVFCPWGNGSDGYVTTYEATRKCFDSPGVPEIHTTQMSFLSEAWVLGYRVFIVDANLNKIRIENGMSGVDKELRPTHDLYRLWRSGALGAELLPK